MLKRRRSLDHARTHLENRERICFICLKKKNKIIRIKGKMEERIQKIVEYDAEDDRIPNAVCDACQILVYRADKNDSIQLKLEIEVNLILRKSQEIGKYRKLWRRSAQDAYL